MAPFGQPATAYGRQYCGSQTHVHGAETGHICLPLKHSDREVAFDPEILLACASSHGTLIYRTRDERKILIMPLNLKFGNAETYLLVLGSL